MNKIIVNLREVNNKLNKRYEELSKLKEDPPGFDLQEKYDNGVHIAYELAELSELITKYDFIIAHKEASEVIVNRPTQEEIDNINKALDDLNRVIQKEQNFEQTLKTITAVLDAGNKVYQASRSGEPKK